VRHRPEGIDALLASQRGMASARFFVYRDALPWFGPAMAEAGWPATSEATRAVLARAHQAWTELTGLAPLATVDAWRDVLALTAEPGDILDLEWTEVRRRVSAWVKRQRWEEDGKHPPAPPPSQPAIDILHDPADLEVKRIAADATRGGNERMRAIIGIDVRYAGKPSTWWAELLGVLDGTVRSYETWKAIQRQRRAAD
jgi:hypothetical protein